MKKIPSMDEWLREAKQAPDAARCGMYLAHNGVVRITQKAAARGLDASAAATVPVTGMDFSYDEAKVAEVILAARGLEGIFFVKVWLNEGRLKVGDDLMYVMIGGDIRPHVVDALQYLVGRLKDECVIEKELK